MLLTNKTQKRTLGLLTRVILLFLLIFISSATHATVAIKYYTDAQLINSLPLDAQVTFTHDFFIFAEITSPAGTINSVNFDLDIDTPDTLVNVYADTVSPYNLKETPVGEVLPFPINSLTRDGLYTLRVQYFIDGNATPQEPTTVTFNVLRSIKINYFTDTTFLNSLPLDAQVTFTRDFYVFAEITNANGVVQNVNFDLDVTTPNTFENVYVDTISPYNLNEDIDGAVMPFPINTLSRDGAFNLKVKYFINGLEQETATRTFNVLRPSTYLPPITNLILSNDIPVAHAGDDKTENEGVEVILDGSTSVDTDGTVDRYEWTQQLPEGSTAAEILDNTQATLSFVAPQISVASTTLTFSLVVYDNENDPSIADTVDVVVNNVNNIPKPHYQYYQVEVDGSVAGVLDAEELDESEKATLAYSLTQSPIKGGLQFNEGSQTKFVYTPNGGEIGKDRLNFTVFDGFDTSEPGIIEFFINASNNTDPSSPKLAIPKNESDGHGSIVELGWKEAIDPENNPIRYQVLYCTDPALLSCTPVEISEGNSRLAELGALYGSGTAILLLGLAGIKRNRKWNLIIVAAIGFMAFLTHCGSVFDDPEKPDIIYKATDLAPNTTYYWKVIANDDFGGVSASEVRNFKTG